MELGEQVEGVQRRQLVHLHRLQRIQRLLVARLQLGPGLGHSFEQVEGQLLPYLLMGALFVALVAATSRRDTSRILLVLGGLIAALAFSIPFSLSFDKHPDALSGLVILPVFAVTNLVLLPVSVVLTRKLSRTPGRPRVWLAYALASIYLLSVISMLNG